MERVTIQQAASRLGVSPDTVRRWMWSGKLKAVREPRPQGFRWLVELPVDQRIAELERQVAALQTERAALVAILDARTAEVARLQALFCGSPAHVGGESPPPGQRSSGPADQGSRTVPRTAGSPRPAVTILELRHWREERVQRFAQMRQHWQEEVGRCQEERLRWDDGLSDSGLPVGANNRPASA